MQTQGEQRVSAGESCGSLGTLPSEKGFNQQLLTGRARRKNERFVHSTDFSHSLGHADNSPDPLPCLMAQIGLLPPATHSPGRESPTNIFISLCCDPEACDHQEIPQAHQRGGGLSLPSQPVLGLARHFGLRGSCPGGDMEFLDQSGPVLPGSREFSELSASLGAAVTRAAV